MIFMKKLCLGLLALALSTVSCKHFYDIDQYPERSYCFNLYFQAKEIAGQKQDSDMIKLFYQEPWCEDFKKNLTEDIKLLEDYIKVHK